MMAGFEKKVVPQLTANPTNLHFGSIEPKKFKAIEPRIIKISNIGGGILAGRIIPQVPWIGISPPDFSCLRGETSSHTVSLLLNSPDSWKYHKFTFEFILLINSNGGSDVIGCDYIIDPAVNSLASPGPKVPTHFSRSIWIWMVVLTIILFSAITASLYLLQYGVRTKNVNLTNILYTQAASTVLSQYSAAGMKPIPGDQPGGNASGISTQEISTLTPPLFRADSHTPVAQTFTPWPRNDFPNPELFVRDYYSAINDGNYERSWSMLSNNFQNSCCEIAGNSPFFVYKNWWLTIKQVEVLSVVLQQWDTNPATLHVSLRYITMDGHTMDTFNIFELISDPERKTLLIDRVK